MPKFTDTDHFVVFDVESIGIHGEGFAVGWVEIVPSGEVLFHGHYYCDPTRADAAPGLRHTNINQTDRRWVENNVRKYLHPRDFLANPKSVREVFWRFWEDAKKRAEEGSYTVYLAAEVPWPVEARFLNACILDKPYERHWGGPYPLIDIASVMFAAGWNPNEDFHRNEDEPEHNALGDARQSARLLLEALRALGRIRTPTRPPRAPVSGRGRGAL